MRANGSAMAGTKKKDLSVDAKVDKITLATTKEQKDGNVLTSMNVTLTCVKCALDGPFTAKRLARLLD